MGETPPAVPAPLPIEQTQPQPWSNRGELLQDYFLDMANSGTHFSGHTLDYLKNGGSLRLCLNEIIDLFGPSQEDLQIASTREAYLHEVLHKARVIGRNGHAAHVKTTEAAYVGAIVDKVTSILDAQTPDDALAIRQLPTLVEGTSFDDGKEITPEDFAAHHLYILMDTALKEHVARREFIDEYRRNGHLARLIGNRALRLGVAGGVFAASLSPRLHFIHGMDKSITEDIDQVVRILSGSVLALDTPEAVRLGLLDVKHAKEFKSMHEELAGDKQNSDLALRVAYNATRYDVSSPYAPVTDRYGTDDKHENLRRFGKLDKEFKHLNNDPGGKPYNGDQALGYAARLLIGRKAQLMDIIDPHKPASQQRQLYLQLVREIIIEDLTRMKKGLALNSVRKVVQRSLAVGVSMFIPGQLSRTNDAWSLGRDTVDAFMPHKDSTDDT